MPYYQWKGVNLQAKICTGIQFARNSNQLDKLLYEKDIALLSCKIKKYWLTTSISYQEKNDYFTHLAMLTKAGILLPQALDIVAQQMNHNKFSQIAYEIADAVQEGNLLVTAFCRYKMFDLTMIQMVAVGQESGYISQSFQALSQHGQTMMDFKSRVRSALLLPIVTLCFFFAIFLFILIFIIPQFITIFKTMHKELPYSTRILINLSNCVRSWYGLGVLGIMIAFASGLYHWNKNITSKRFFDRWLLKFPLTRALIINKTFALFFQSMSLLILGGLPIVQAFKIATASIDNMLIKQSMSGMEHQLNAGQSFAAVLSQCPLLRQDVIALIHVGQESGALSDIMARISNMYQQRLIRGLSRVTLLMQPFLLIILGLLISALILALVQSNYDFFSCYIIVFYCTYLH